MNLWLKCLPGSAGKKENRARSMPARMIMAVFLLVIAGNLIFQPVAQAAEVTRETAQAMMKKIAVGYSHVVAIKADGSLVAWGSNKYGECNVPGGNNYVAVSAGTHFSVALRADGTLVAWGNNTAGECDVPGGQYKAVAAGRGFGVAIALNGSLVDWGRNMFGEYNMPAGNDYVAVAAGEYYGVALRANGSLVPWGNNENDNYNVPIGKNYVAVAVAITNVIETESISLTYSIALGTDGTVAVWGRKYSYMDMFNVPSGNFVAATVGSFYCVALRSDGTLADWGTLTCYPNRSQVPGGNNYVAVVSNSGASVALKMDGTLVAWGSNYYGQCNVPPGLDLIPPDAPGTPTADVGPDINCAEKTAGVVVRVPLGESKAAAGNTVELLVDGAPFATPVTHTLTAEEIAAGSCTVTIPATAGGGWAIAGNKEITARIIDGAGTGPAGKALTLNLTIQIVTFNKNGGDTEVNPQIAVATPGAGVGNLPAPPTKAGYVFAGWFTAAVGGDVFTAATSVTTDLTVYAHWITTEQARVSALIKKISAGLSHSVALKSGGNLMAWGNNDNGQCEVPEGYNYVAIAAGAYHNVALKTDGSLAAWGKNDDDQCRVPEGNYVAVAAGGYHNIALKQDGSLAAWGNNAYGQCNVPSGNNYVAVAAGLYYSIALKSDGSLVAWGDKHYDLRDVPEGNNYMAMAAGFYHGVALTMDGTLAAWGDNNYRQCDDVPNGDNFVAVTSGAVHCVALKTDRTLAAWGDNTFGQCNVPGGNNYVAIAAGIRHTIALKSDGTPVAWGNNDSGECNVPDELDLIPPDAPGTPTTSAGPDINLAEKAAGVDVIVPLGTSKAAAGDTVKLLVNGTEFGTPVVHTITAAEITTARCTVTIPASAGGGWATDGSKTITARIIDGTGPGPVSQALTLNMDTVVPSGDLTINNGSDLTNSPAVTLTITANDTGSETLRMRFSNDNQSWSDWETSALPKSWNLGAATDRVCIVYAEIKDLAGNVGALSGTITVKVGNPVFTPAGGYFNSPCVVSITCTTPGAEIRYTTDGSEPTETSKLYDRSPVRISSTATVTAKAFKSGWPSSDSISASYTMNSTTITYQPDGSTPSTSADLLQTAQNYRNTLPVQYDSATLSLGKGQSGSYSDLWLYYPNLIGSGTGQIPSDAKIVTAKLVLTLKETKGNQNQPRGFKLYQITDPGFKGTPYFGQSGIRNGLDFQYRDHRPGMNIKWKDGAGDITGLFTGIDPVDTYELIPSSFQAEGYSEIRLDVTASVQDWLSGDAKKANQGWFLTVDPLQNWGYNDSLVFYGADDSTVAHRPKLEVTYVSSDIDNKPPDKVADLKDVPGNAQVILSWTPPGTDCSGVLIVRKAGVIPCDPTDGTVVYDGTANSQLDNQGLVNGKTYYYAAFAYDSLRNYSRKAWVSAIPGASIAPNAPSGLTVNLTGDNLSFSWADNSSDENYFVLEQQEGGSGAWTPVAYPDAGQTSLNVKHDNPNFGLKPGTAYQYRMKAVNAFGSSGYTQNSSGITTPEFPAAPANLTWTIISAGRVNLSWTDVATTETGYRIDLCRNNPGQTVVQSINLSADSSVYSVTGLNPGMEYIIKVVAVNSIGETAAQSDVIVTTADPKGGLL